MNRRRFLAIAALLPLIDITAPRLLAYGDSITVGDGATDHALGYASLLARRMGLFLDNRAVSGTKVADHRATIEGTLFHSDDTIVFLTGYNDMRIGTSLSDYRADLRACLALIPGAYVGDCLRMPQSSYAIPPNDKGSDDRVLAFNQVIAEECRRVNCRLVHASRVYDPATQCDDRIHPNDAGHQTLAWAFLATMRRIVYLAEWR